MPTVTKQPPGPTAPSKVVLAALAAMPSVSASRTELAASLGLTDGQLAPLLDALDRADLVELWDDPERYGAVRVMLSARAAVRLGLKLSPRGDRWQPAEHSPRPAVRRRRPTPGPRDKGMPGRAFAELLLRALSRRSTAGGAAVPGTDADRHPLGQAVSS